MNRNRWRFSKPAIAIVVFGLAVGLLAGLTALVTGKPATGRRMGLEDDWSTHHLIFSNPGTAADALAHGRFEQWYRTINDPRFLMQQMKRSHQQLAAGAIAAPSPLPGSLAALRVVTWGPGAPEFPEPIRRLPVPKRPQPKPKPKGDWSYALGGTEEAAVNAAMYPAKYTFNVNDTPDCTKDFVVFAIDKAGASSQPTILAFNELYSGSSPTGICGSSAPTVMWAYNAATTPVMTSPILSLDGTMVAFVEEGPPAILHILRPESGEGGTYLAPVAPKTTVTSTSPTASSDWAACLAGSTSCMFNLTYTTSSNTNSSPFYNYDKETLYVGDNGGVLWKINPVFNGTPALASDWQSITVNSSKILTGPVFDPVSNNIFVGDSAGLLWYVMDTGSTEGTCASGSPPCLGTPSVDATHNGHGSPVKDAPLVDSVSQKVFVFDAGAAGGSTSAYVTQTDTALGNEVAAPVGTTDGSNNIHDGAFDNNYYTGNYTSGNLYVCGNPYGGSYPMLYSITFTNSPSTGTMSSTSTAGPQLGTSRGAGNFQECSPLTEIYNTSTTPNPTDWLFLGVYNCPNTSPSSGCVESFDITSGPPGSSASPTNQSSESEGSSGIVVDDVSSEAQASSLYFSTLGDASCGTPGFDIGSACAVKLTQSGLH